MQRWAIRTPSSDGDERMGKVRRGSRSLARDDQQASSKPASRRTSSPTALLAQLGEALGLPEGTPVWRLGVPDLDELLGATRKRLLDLARPLGLSGLSRLTKDALARRVQLALQAIIRATEAPPSSRDAGADADAPHKFDLGLPPEPAREPPAIPWGYGRDRVTVTMVDPERLYVYWEVTDEAIERARAGLGPAGGEAWLNLRVYDVTGRIFDGTNAHGYFDHRIERGDRHWFLHVGKPASTACVELGMKSREGYFVRIVRSGRADFPRREPAPPGPVEWLTVRTATGEMEASVPARSGAAEEAAHRPPATAGSGAPEAWPAATPSAAWDVHEQDGIFPKQFEGHWDWREIVRHEWREGGGVLEWMSPVTRTSWEVGPLEAAVESPSYVEERHEGAGSTYIRDGRRHVVYGPWQVVIRGLGARAERRVLAVWEVTRSWVAGSGAEARVPAAPQSLVPGASELFALAASVQRWLVGSEVRLGGASEVFRVGASELRYGGASETLFAGASERRLRGASEWRYIGASEWRAAGASERRLGGASESQTAGASERRLGGASESRPPDGSAAAPLQRRRAR